MRLRRLSGRKTCAFVQRKGNVWKSKTFLARWLPGAPRIERPGQGRDGIFVGTLASTALDKSAVRRNRMRRRVREALRVTVLPLSEVPTVQLLLCPRSASLDAPFADIQADVVSLLSTLRTACPKAPPPANRVSPSPPAPSSSSQSS